MDVFEALRGGCDLPDDYDVGAVSRFLPALLLRASGHPHNFARYQSLCAGNPRAERIAVYAAVDFSEVLLTSGLFHGSVSRSAAGLHVGTCESSEGTSNQRGVAMRRTASDVIREYSKDRAGDDVDEGDESCSAYEDAEAEGGDDAMDDQSDNHSHPDDAFPEDSPGGGGLDAGSEDALWWAHQEVDALEDPVAAEQERVELEFEIAGEARRVHLLLHELRHMLSDADGPTSHLFDSPALLEELLCMLPVVLAKCHHALSPVATARALLASQHGPQLVSAIVANLPQCLSAVVNMLASACAAGAHGALPPNTTAPSTDPGIGTEYSTAQDWARRVRRAAEACLMEICNMSASTRGEVRAALKAERAAPALAMHITLAHLKDEVEFVSSVVYEGAASREWLLESLNKEAQAHVTPTSCATSFELGAGALLANLERSLLHRAQQSVAYDRWRGDAHANLRLFCALLACGVMPLPSSLADFWLTELAKPKAVTAQTVNLFSTLLFLLAANGAPLEDPEAPVTVAVLAAANHVFLNINNDNSKNNNNSNGHNDHNDHNVESVLHKDPEVLAQSTWWRAHLMASMQGASAINDQLGRCLGVPHVPVTEPTLVKMKKALSSSRTLDARAAAAALAACPLPRHLHQGLRYNHPAVVVAESATQLISSGVIQQTEVDLVPTIQAALETGREPLHPTLPSLIRVYAHAAMTPAPLAAAPATAPHAIVSGLPLQLLKGLFARAPEGGVVRGDKRGVASGGAGSLELGRALGAYYVLCCEDARHLPRAGARQDVPASVCGYDAEDWELLLASVPVNSLARHMQAVPGYSTLLPEWMGLASRFLPERCMSLIAMDEDAPRCFSTAAEMVAASAFAPAGATSADSAPLANASALDRDTARAYLANALTNPLAAATYLEALVLEGSKEVNWELDAGGCWPHGEMVVRTLAPRLAHPRCSRRLHLLFVRWWKQLPLAARGVLLPVLTSAWGGGEHDEDGSTKLVGTLTEMQCAPLSLLACSRRVWRASLLVNLLLEELTPLLGAARRRVLQSQAVRSEEVSVVALAQSSAVVQMLLEACHSNYLSATSDEADKDADKDDDEDADEACRIIFAYVSAMFIEDPLLLKCVHFQGYDVGMVRAVVERVPCAHACIAFLPELLAQPQSTSQLFATVLAAELAAKYPLENSLAAAQTALGLAMKATESGDHSFLEASLEALGRAAATLPAMLPDALTVLHRCVNSQSDNLKLRAETAYNNMLERRVLVGH